MAASIVVEEEHGTYSRTPHRHDGYYAGDFTVHPAHLPVPPPRIDRPQPSALQSR